MVEFCNPFPTSLTTKGTKFLINICNVKQKGSRLMKFRLFQMIRTRKISFLGWCFNNQPSQPENYFQNFLWWRIRINKLYMFTTDLNPKVYATFRTDPFNHFHTHRSLRLSINNLQLWTFDDRFNNLIISSTVVISISHLLYTATVYINSMPC